MAKRRRKRKSTKCPEPLNTIIDIIFGMIMSLIADKMERRHHYRKRGVPNPYRASAIGIATGRLENTEDLIKLGGFLGAMGAFDSDDTGTNYRNHVPKTSRNYKNNIQDRCVVNNSREFEKISVPFSTEYDQYAWRVNCQDGSAYGIYPEDFETEEAYNQALFDAFVIDDIDENEDTEVPFVFGETALENENKQEYT